MPLLWDTEPVRFIDPLNPNDWIDLKAELTSGDDDAVWESMAKVDASSAEDLRVSVRATALNRERVRRSITAWSYTKDGHPVPVTPENVDRLDRTTYAALIAKVDELNPLVLPSVNGTSSTGSAPGTAATQARRRTA